MIFKVLYQDLPNEAPVRERTQCLYIEAASERDVRLKLKDHHINIELIQSLNEAHLAYEKQSERFVMENI